MFEVPTNTTWLAIRTKLKEYFEIVAQDVGFIEHDTSIDDWSDIINEALTNYSTVILGDNLTQVFQIKKPIYMKSNTRLYNNGTIFNADAIIVDITQDALIGSTRFYVSSVAGFEVGMFVGCHTPLPLGAKNFVRQLGLITNIGSNYIDTEKPLALEDMLVSNNVKFFTYNPCIWFYNIVNAYLIGGVVDGNKTKQIFGEPDSLPSGIINVYFQNTDYCGIAGRALIINSASTNISVFGAFGTNYDANTNMYFDCIARGSYDKNMILGRCNNVTIPYFEGTGSIHEDGFITYVYCSDVRVGTLVVKNNGRYGFANNNLAKNITVDTLIAEDNGVNLHHAGIDLKIGQAILRRGGRYHQNNSDRGSIQFHTQYNAGGNVQIGSLEIEFPLSTRMIRFIGGLGSLKGPIKNVQIGMVIMRDDGTPRIGWSVEGANGVAATNVHVLSCFYDNVATEKNISDDAVNVNIP